MVCTPPVAGETQALRTAGSPVLPRCWQVQNLPSAPTLSVGDRARVPAARYAAQSSGPRRGLPCRSQGTCETLNSGCPDHWSPTEAAHDHHAVPSSEHGCGTQRQRHGRPRRHAAPHAAATETGSRREQGVALGHTAGLTLTGTRTRTLPSGCSVRGGQLSCPTAQLPAFLVSF